MMQVALSIKGFNYLITVSFFAAGFILYILYKKCLHTDKYRIIFTVFIVVIISSLYFFYNPFAVFIHKAFAANLLQITHEIMLQKYTYFSQFIPIFACIIPISAAAITALNKKGFGYAAVIYALSIVLFLWYLGYDMEMQIYIYPFALICMLIWGINTYKRYIEKAASKEYRVNVDVKNVLRLITFACLSVVLLSFLSIKIFGIKSIPEAINDAVLKDSKVQEGVKKNRYGLQLSGYNNSDYRLGGSVIPDTAVAFRVRCSQPMYLKGAVKILYDGSMWKREEYELEEFSSGVIPNPGQSSGTSIYNVQPQSNVQDYFSKGSITIYPENLDTSSLFTPIYASGIHMDGGIFSIDNAGNLTIRNSTNVKKSYTADYIKSDSGVEEFPNGYKAGYRISYEKADTDYARIKDNYYMYLQVPGNISPKIYSLAEKITRNCSSSSEKVLKIQDYLSKNYKYSLDVSNVPAGKEFLDYFLFTEKKGYCTYFATACTIFCRIAGIPARYVEGFKMQDKKDSSGLYIVSNDMAHAWTEVLVDPDENIWSIVDAVPPDSEEVLQDYITAAPGNASMGAASENNSSASESSFKKSVDVPQNSIWSALEAAPFAIAILLVLYIIWSVIMFKRKAASMLTSNSLVPVYRYTKERLQTCKIHDSSIKDDIKWINSISDSEFKVRVQDMISSVYAEYYGNIHDTNFDRRKFYEYLEHYIRDRQNILKYLILKYTLKIDFK